MTLAEWTKESGILPTHPTTEKGAVSVIVATISPHYRALWTLDDYAVDSSFERFGIEIVWLLPVR
jgi:hypothetical protein